MSAPTTETEARTERAAAGGNGRADTRGPVGPARSTADVAELADRVLFRNYGRAPVAFSHGRGARLWDLEGKEYLDFLAGIAVSALGHAHPALVEAIAAQAGRYLHVSNLYHIPEQAEAARLLVEAGGLDRVFFCNSGAEANEAAIKLARKWALAERGEGAFGIVAAEGSFHGRTLGALAATGVEKYRAPFEPLPAGFRFVPYDDLPAAEAAIGPETCAVLVEPIQGEAGVIPPSEGYVRGLRALTEERGVLLILDEVQTGIGRTGDMFAFQGLGVEPDVVTLAKGLGGGVPVGAMLAREAVAAHLVPGDHATTFGGNPLVSAAVAAVLRTIREEGLLERVRVCGARLRAGLEALRDRGAGISGVRGAGLLLAADLADELGTDAPAVVRACLERGLLLNAPRPRTLRLAPPLIVTEAEVDEALDILGAVLAEAGG